MRQIKIFSFLVFLFLSPLFIESQEESERLNRCKIEKIQRPLVFIPGIMGSQLYNVNSQGVGILIWPPYLNEYSTFSQLLEQGQVFVNYSTDGLFPVVYGSLIYNLRLMGYDDENLWIYTYDWRRSCQESGLKLIDFLKKKMARYQKIHNVSINEVDLVCHSMGGIVARSAYKTMMERQDKDICIKRIVYIASPHFGSPKAYFTLHPNIKYIFFELKAFEQWAMEYFWKHASRPGDLDKLFDGLKNLSKTLPSLYELLPDKFYFHDGQERLVYPEPVGVENSIGLYQSSNTKIALPVAYHTLINTALQFKESLGEEIPPGKGKKLLIYSAGIETPTFIDMDTWFDPKPSSSLEGGDGTVPVKSATANLPLNDSDVARSFGDHNTIVESAETVRLLRIFLGKEEGPLENSYKAHTDVNMQAAENALAVKNYALAKSKYEDALKGNHPEAAYKLAFLYETGKDGFPADKKQSAFYYWYSANLGYQPAMLKIAQVYQEGSIEKNTIKSMFWLERAARLKNIEAMMKLADMAKQSGMLSAAIQWYTQVDTPESNYQLGMIYEAQKDIEKAKNWYFKAAKQNNMASLQKMKDLNMLAGLDFFRIQASGFDFSDADLSSTNFSFANLEGCKFKNSILYKANFSDARLNGSNLVKANLLEANMFNADMSNVDWKNTKLDKSNFSYVCLSDAQNLTTEQIARCLKLEKPKKCHRSFLIEIKKINPDLMDWWNGRNWDDSKQDYCD